jgi:hypothetical protein
MPAPPNFNESADWMTQYTYFPRPPSADDCASSARCACTFSRGAIAPLFAAGAARFTVRGFDFVVFFAMKR